MVGCGRKGQLVGYRKKMKSKKITMWIEFLDERMGGDCNNSKKK